MTSTNSAAVLAKYNRFPDEATSQSLREMQEYFANRGTTPMRVFQDIDEADAGKLSYWAFYKGFKSKGFKLDQKIAEKLMQLLDQNSTGTVELRAFEKVFDHLLYKEKKKEQLEAQSHPPSATWDKVVEVLSRKKGTMTDHIMELDTDKSGSLSYWEFSQGLKKLGLKLDKRQTEQLLSDIDTNGDGEVSIGEFVSAVMAHVGQREQEAKDAANKASLAAERAAIREVERAEFEQQQKDAIKAANLSSYEVRAAWNKVNRAIRKKGRVQMTKLFHEFDTDGGGTVDRSEFKSGLARLGVKLSGPEFEACWQYADPRGEGELSEEYFVSGLGEIDPNVDEDDKAANVGEIAKRRASLAGLADNTADGAFADESVELHDAWLALCKYFNPQRKARALATFKQLDTDRSGTLDQMEFKMFIAMLNLKLTDAEQGALWRELDTDESGTLTFLEIQTAVSERERVAAEAKQTKEAERLRAAKALKHSAEVSKEVLRTADAWEELNAFAVRNGPSAVRKFLSSFDSTGHETLSKEEFRNALMAGPKLDLDEETFEAVWQDVDLAGHNEIDFEEFARSVEVNHHKAQAVIAGTWLPSEEDRRRDKLKAETVKHKAKLEKEQQKLARRASLAAAREAKKGKIAKITGDQQISAKALQLLRRRRALYKARHSNTVEFGRVPYHRTRQVAMAVVVGAAVQQYLAIRVFYLLEGTGAWSQIANVSLLICAIWAILTSFLQHWTAVSLFFIIVLLSMVAVICNILTNLNTYVFLADIASNCYSPIEAPVEENYCFDKGSRSQAQCVCTDDSVRECYEFTPGQDSTSSCDPKEAQVELLVAAIGAVVTFVLAVFLWATIGCFAPVYFAPHGFYYMLLARGKLAVTLAQQKSRLAEGRSAAMKQYKKKKKAREAAVGFANLVMALKSATSTDGNQGGALQVFSQMDSANTGNLNQLSFRAGLQELGIKAAAADVNKLWDFMDSDHSGSITFADFAAGLKRAVREIETMNADDDIEGGPKGGAHGNSQIAWDKLHSYLQQIEITPYDFFREEIDQENMLSLDLHMFEEGLHAISNTSNGNLNLENEDILMLWDDTLAESTTMAPDDENPIIEAEDFEAAMDAHPPS